MARPKGTKNVMRTPEEKEKIILEASRCGVRPTCRKYGIDQHSIREWVAKYNRGGLECLKSNTEKHLEQDMEDQSNQKIVNKN